MTENGLKRCPVRHFNGWTKSHIAIGLGLAACRQGKRVRFYGVASLVNDLLAAQKDLKLSKLMGQIGKLDVVYPID